MKLLKVSLEFCNAFELEAALTWHPGAVQQASLLQYMSSFQHDPLILC